MSGSFNEEPKEARDTEVKLNKVSSQKSMFDNAPKKPTQQEFQQQVQQVHEKSSSYKIRAAELANNFSQLMSDKTLAQNKNPFANEVRRELLGNMVQLAKDINNDPNELEGDGSLIWIIVLFNTCFDQRDRINQLEYNLSKLSNGTILTDYISKEIAKVLDKKTISG